MKKLLMMLAERWARASWAWRAFGILSGVLLLILLLPARQAAACDFGDVGCAGDQMMYNAMIVAARILWTVNRLMLVIAYLLDAIRTEIVEQLFLGAYTQLTTLVDQALIPVAILALTVALIAILATPLTGAASPFNIRQILLIVMLAPVLLLGLGTWLGDLDTMRVDIGQTLYSAASSSHMSGFIQSVSPQVGDLAPPPYLYGQGMSAACGNVIFRRYSGGTEGSMSLRPDELAANYLYADTQDIHCPDQHAGDVAVAGLPAKWSEAGSPGYVHGDDIGDEMLSVRTAWKDKLNEGIIRLFLGLFVSALALVYYAAHLVFTLALVALWVGIPIGLLFGMFRKDFSWAAEFFKSGADTLRNSWVTSFIIGLLTAGLIAAAESGNATVFAGIATGQLIFLVFTFLNAISTLKLALSALSSLGGAVAGGGTLLGSAARMVGGAAAGGGGVALGLTGHALKGTAGGVAEAGRMAGLGLAAARESGSGTFGLAAALGRNARVMKAGEIARTMGVLRGDGGEAVLDAMRAGHASTRKAPGGLSGAVNFKAFNQQLRGSGKIADKIKADAEARATQQHATLAARQKKKVARRQQEGEQRATARIGALRRGNVAQRGVAAAQAAPEATRRATGAAAQVFGQTADRASLTTQALGAYFGTNRDPYTMVAGAVAAGRTLMRRGVSVGSAAVRQGAQRGSVALRERGARTVDAIRRGMDPEERYASAWQLDEQGSPQAIRDLAQRIPPEHARRGEFTDEELYGEMQGGARVRFHEDNSTSVWSAHAEAASREAHEQVEQEWQQADLDASWAGGAALDAPVNAIAQSPTPPAVEDVPASRTSQRAPARAGVRGRSRGQGRDTKHSFVTPHRSKSPDENLAAKAAQRQNDGAVPGRGQREPQAQAQPQAVPGPSSPAPQTPAQAGASSDDPETYFGQMS